MKEKRNGNVEAFRIVLMAGIVSLHILGHGHLVASVSAIHIGSHVVMGPGVIIRGGSSI